MQLSAIFMSIKNVLFAKRFCKEGNLFIEVSPFDFKYCVILIYRQKVSDGTGFMQVNFGFHTNRGGLSVFPILKRC